MCLSKQFVRLLAFFMLMTSLFSGAMALGFPGGFGGGGKKNPPVALIPKWDLDEVIYTFSDNTPLTVRELLSSSVLITGQRGSGKSSGSLPALLIALLKYGAGGLFLCSTPHDRSLYLACAAKAGVLNKVILFNDPSGLRLNPVDYIYRKSGGEIESVLEMFKRLYDIVDTGASANETENKYFENESMKMLRFCITLLVRAGRRLKIISIARVIESLPQSPKQALDEAWRKESYTFQLVENSEANRITADDYHEHDRLLAFIQAWVKKSSENKSDVTTTLTAKLEPLLHSGMFRMFSQGTNTLPDLTFTTGALIIIDIPAQDILGRMSNVIWKSCFYEALKQRNMGKFPRPVCLVQDEAHTTILDTDIKEALPNIRSQGCVVISASQSLLNFDVALEDKTLSDDYVALFGLRIHHANSDNTRTNKIASDSIGQEVQTWDLPPDLPTELDGLDVGHLRHQKHVYYKVPPEKFNELMRAGPPEWKTEAVAVMSGKKFVSTGEHWAVVAFPQFLYDLKRGA